MGVFLRFFCRSIVRVGLQEAFQFAKSDFIQRSRLRMERVKNARNLVKRRKDIGNLKERDIDDAVLKGNAVAIRTQCVGMFLGYF